MKQMAMVVTGTLSLSLGAPAAQAGGPTPLEKPAFTATPAELLAAAKAAPAGDWPVVVLRHDAEISADEQGRFAHRIRKVYVVRTQAGVEWWGAIQWKWSPYHQDRPRVRARVIEPGGAVTELDPKLVTDTPEISMSPTIYSDRHRLAAPLPRLAVGAVVEYEIIATEHQPRLAAGDAELFGIGGPVPTSSLQVVLSAPAARKAKLFAHDLPGGAKPVHRIERGRESWTYAFDALAPRRPLEAGVPGDGPEQPYVGLSTAASWNAVAREYHKIVERRIADGPVQLPAGLPRAPTQDTVNAITAWLHRQVRYTGIELGPASIVPWPPAETLARGFGDCKDKATLLVALLRQAGLRADVALLDTGPGRDTDAELPGLPFDHAIVRVKIGGRDVWIDATAELTQVGRLPANDQGRRALIIAGETTALTPTPSTVAADNTARQVRTIEISESGAATRVTELTLEGGTFEPYQRRWFRDTRAEDIKEDLTSYATSAYGATYARHGATTPEDLGTPFALTLEATSANRVWTHRDHIELTLRPSDTFAQVPSFMLRAEEPSEPRRADFLWSIPHVYEIEHRLILPPGYTAPGLPPERSVKLGPATLTERYRLDGRTVVAVFRFDSGKPRLSPAELALLQKELAAVRGRPVKLAIEHTGWALADAHKPKQAIAEIERLIRLHPTEALHHTELAYAYTKAGMGAAARRAARRAVELEPRNADAYGILGWVLRRDTFGREHGFDHDRGGALAAYARARELDPKHAGAAADHGDLLARDARGRAYEPGADLPRAIEALRAAHAIDATDENGLALARALLFSSSAASSAASAAASSAANALAEAERVLRALDPSNARDGMLVAVLAAGPGGPPAATQLADSLRTGAARTAILESAMQLMLYTRRYDAMRALLAHSGAAPAGTPRHQIAQRLETAAPPLGRDPKPLAFEVVRLTYEPEHASAAFWDRQTADEFRRGNSALPPVADSLPRAVFGDLARAVTEVTVTGTEAAWRLEINAFGHRAQLYAALDRGTAKLVGSASNADGLGRHALRLLARGDLESAARCIDWLVQDSPNGAAMLGKIWGPGRPRDREAIALAGAIATGGSDADRLIATATRCPSTLPDARETCDRALTIGLYVQKRWRELEAHASAWAGRATDTRLATIARVDALSWLGRYDEADQALDALRAASPSDNQVAELWPRIAIQRADLAEAARRYDALLQRPGATPGEHNEAAWLRLFLETDLSAALDLARKAAGTDRARGPALALNTLAVIEAELGELGPAVLDGWQAMENADRATPENADWYLYGRIAEQLGLRDDAIAAYRRVAPDPDPHSSHKLAKRRLAKLAVTP
ncbi:MAG TPA: DUF3857 domain-containing protein [Kofleriaceae bacterium]|nr:DUF3857 domain-containing protein [Kofleriaceae bacterium]